MNALYDPCLYSYVALDHLSVYKKAPAVNLAVYVWPYLAAKTKRWWWNDLILAFIWARCVPSTFELINLSRVSYQIVAFSLNDEIKNEKYF